MSITLQDTESGKITIPANSFVPVASTGQFVRCLSSSNDFELSFNNGAKTFFAGGLKRELPEHSEDFTSFELWNNTGDPIDVTLIWGFGDVEDNRLSVNAPIQIENKTGTSLSVTNNNFSELFHIRNGISSVSSRLSKTSYAKFTNVSSAEVSGATAEIVTAAENTSGVYIYNLCISARGGFSTVKIGGDHIYKSDTHSGASDTVVWPMVIYVPSGKSIELYTSHSASTICMNYEVL